MMDTIKCIETKRSVRAYTEEVISDEMMNQLIELGTKAPTRLDKI